MYLGAVSLVPSQRGTLKSARLLMTDRVMAVGAARNVLAFSDESVSRDERCHHPDLSASATGVATGGGRAASGQNRRGSHFCSPTRTNINPKQVQCQRGRTCSLLSCRCHHRSVGSLSSQHRVRLDAFFQNLVFSFKNALFTRSPFCPPCCHFSP